MGRSSGYNSDIISDIVYDYYRNYIINIKEKHAKF